MPRPVIRCCCRRPARASTSSATSRTGATSSGRWWGGYDQEHLGPDQGQGRADRPGTLRPLGHQRDGPLVLGDRQGPAAAGHGADRHRPDRRRRRLARRRPALFGRQRPFLRALLFLAPARVDRARRAGDDRHFDDAQGPRAALEPVRRGLLLRAADLRSGPRPGGERRPTLDQLRPRPGPAVGVPQAVLRRRRWPGC